MEQKKRGRPSKAELERRAAEKAAFEQRMKEMEERMAEEERLCKPHLDAISNILDNIDLGNYSDKWNRYQSTCSAINKNGVSISSGSFGGSYPNEHYFMIDVYYNKAEQKFVNRVSQCRMGNLEEMDLNNLIAETNNIKPMLENIKKATDKVLEYAKANNVKLY